MLILLIGVGILMTVRNKGLQFRKFGYAMKNTIGKIFKRTHAGGGGDHPPFQAVSTALAGTVGTGNIAGITTAVTLGGPGTLFWLWVTALIGMATKYSEVLLAVKFRERNKYGDWVGGPMYYIKNGLGRTGNGWASSSVFLLHWLRWARAMPFRRAILWVPFTQQFWRLILISVEKPP